MGPAGIFFIAAIFLFLLGKRRAAFWSVAIGFIVGLLWYVVHTG
jgi:hypothetical protein